MEHILNEIKSQLFDAPKEVKSAFNNVVTYFAKGESKEPTEEDVQLEKFEEELDELLAKYLKSSDNELRKDVLRTMGAKIVIQNKSALLTRTCRSIGNAIAYACKSGPSNSVQTYWNSMM